MIAEIKQVLLNVAAISTFIILLFFTLIGVDTVLKIGTFWGYIFTMLCTLSLTFCCCVSIHASQSTKGESQ